VVGLIVPQSLLAMEGESPRGHLGAGVNLGWYTIGGEDLEGIHDGLGVETYGGLGLRGRIGFDLNIGFHYSRHDLDVSTYYLNLYGIYLEPRFVYGGDSRGVSPFLGARVGWVGRVAENRRTGRSIESDGFVLGAVLGVDVPVPGPFLIEAALSVSDVSFDHWFLGSLGLHDTGAVTGLQVGVTLPIIG
jgi:hypothetical protein